jgi:hypothetical protein
MSGCSQHPKSLSRPPPGEEGHKENDMLVPINGVDENKVKVIAKSMAKNGWQGYPLLTIGDDLALTGSHRIAAAARAGIEPETYNLDISRYDILHNPEYWKHDDYPDGYIPGHPDLTEEGEELVEKIDLLTSLSGDDADRLRAIKYLYDAGFVDYYALEIMQAECDKE